MTPIKGKIGERVRYIMPSPTLYGKEGVIIGVEPLRVRWEHGVVTEILRGDVVAVEGKT